METPFIGREALDAGDLTRHQLRSRFAAVYPGVYVAREAQLTARLRAEAAWLWSTRRAVLAGRSAAALHGAKWIDPRAPAELLHDNRHAPPGIRVWADAIADDEIAVIKGMRVTTPARTAVDYACRYQLDQAVAAIDALSNATRLKVAEIESIVARSNGRKGIRRARAVLELVDGGSQSPRETWLRLLIVRAGFPPPQTQVPVRNEYGVVIAHLDMGWEDEKIGLEYEGAHHRLSREQFAYDIRKHEQVREAGWRVLRVTSMDAPATVLTRLSELRASRAPARSG
ncbi:hypothetical protein D8S82_07885 [Mycobacterium hodleri]|uniref:DUF559 domain-containing protein n=1 Tax=Mycolicibacterium hodleri TaxID=49897 RepID=A0A544W4X4_9MYCO|nr:hypothetical protein [Mycolicibacterium hodleri]TQR87288.1 hypothetical protein D8S82_07885 [Mycolicibacterium hodleri]